MTLKYDHLLGRPFVYGTQDCYSVIRDFYLDNYDISFPNYARPTEFWKYDMNMYLDRYKKHNFDLIDCHPTEYRPGDVFLMSISAGVANHAAVLVDNGKILHHMFGRLSTVENYAGMWRNTTVAVVRHRDVPLEKAPELTDIDQYLPESTRKKIRALTQQT